MSDTEAELAGWRILGISGTYIIPAIIRGNRAIRMILLVRTLDVLAERCRSSQTDNCVVECKVIGASVKAWRRGGQSKADKGCTSKKEGQNHCGG